MQPEFMEKLDSQQLKKTIEALLFAASHPLNMKNILALLNNSSKDKSVEEKQVQEALEQLDKECDQRGVVLKQVKSGYCYQTREELTPTVVRLWEEKPPRYTRALLETLALIAYHQPITRADIEEVRGVSVSSYTIQTLEEREWIRVSGHRDTPGKPALYVTTNQFLDYFNLSSLEQLPALMDAADVAEQHPELGMQIPQQVAQEPSSEHEHLDAETSTTPNSDQNDLN